MSFKKVYGVVAVLFVFAPCAQAATVLFDNFDRVGPLNGSTPTITPGGAWVAHSGFATDGSKVNAAFGLFAFTEAAYVPMPVPITSGSVYTLSATMHRGLSTDNTAIMIFGFFDTTPSWNAGAAVDEGHAIAIAPRNNRPGINPMLNGFVNISDIPVADGTDGVTFGVRLFETAPNEWAAVAVELAPTHLVLSSPPTPISIANIASIGMISGSLLPRFIDNFTLDVTPACACLGDTNGDGLRNGEDIQDFVNCLTGSGDCSCADIDASGDVTIDDIVDFVSDLVTGTECP